jgi:hypothetical protein
VHLLDLLRDAMTICGEMLSLLPAARSASPLTFRTIRRYLGCGLFVDFARFGAVGIARRVNTKARNHGKGNSAAAAPYVGHGIHHRLHGWNTDEKSGTGLSLLPSVLILWLVSAPSGVVR